MFGASNEKRILMLGAGPLQVPAILKAKEFGFKVYCADYDERAVGFSHADKGYLVSSTDVDRIIGLAKDLSADYVITSASDAPVQTAALVSEKLALPTGITYANAVCATEKDAMRNRLAREGVPIPLYRSCSNLDSFMDAVRAFDFKCIVKPADSSASRGVQLIDGCIDDAALMDLYAATASHSRKGVVMVEEWLQGPEVSVEAITIDGKTKVIAITDKLVTAPPHFVELGHSEPSCLPKTTQEAIVDVAMAAIDAIGIMSGPSHTEIKITENGPKVIEIAARLGGDFITSKLVPLSTGVDLVGGSVCIALGEEASFEASRQVGCAIRFIVAESKGTISAIRGTDELREASGVYEVSVYKKPGEAIDTPHSSSDRIGHVICLGDTPEEARRLADEALRKVTVEIGVY